MLELDSLIEEIYRAFEPYTLPDEIPGCVDCCVFLSEVEVFRRTPLRKLKESDLDCLDLTVGSCWGRERTFKYFLPRILESWAWHDIMYDLDRCLFHGFWLFRKLRDFHWHQWPQSEFTSIDNLVRWLWKYVLEEEPEWDKWREIWEEVAKNPEELKDLPHFCGYGSIATEFIEEVLIEGYDDLTTFLEVWEEVEDRKKVWQIASFLVDFPRKLSDAEDFDKENTSIPLRREQICQVESWIGRERHRRLLRDFHHHVCPLPMSLIPFWSPIPTGEATETNPNRSL